MSKFIKHARDLKYEEKPDYEYLRKLLKDAAEMNKLQLEDGYDWSNSPAEASKQPEM